MSASSQKIAFEAEVQDLLDLMIHSLYSHREIFLRELVSNASDALDKRRTLALTEPGLLAEGEEPGIRLEPDAAARTLAVVDEGIGMTREELIENLGTIARSGTRRFLEERRAQGGKDLPELIGQFGVGFYSSFMVADEVVVETRRAGDEGPGHRWRSRADGAFEIEEAPDLAYGTRVVLHLKEAGEDEQDFTDEGVLRALVRRYSDFVEHPIRLGEDVLNSRRPLWLRPKDGIEREEYDEFYRHLTHDWHEPLEVVHFKAEGTTEYVAMLYVPAERAFDLFEERRPRSRVSLYVRRVLITSECEELLPPWLRFVRGVVEAPDLPLNVSRELLQNNPHVRRIRERLVKKVLDALARLAAEERERYAGFWAAHGAVLKEGICAGQDEDGRVARLCLFESSRGEGRTTLAEYVERMPAEQEELLYMTGADARTLAASPHVEAFRALGREVLFFTDPIDEWMIDRLTEFEGKSLRSVHDAKLERLDGAARERVAQAAEEERELLGALAEHYGDEVSEVRFTAGAGGSPALLVSEQGAPRPHVARALREMHGAVPTPPRILELDLDHPACGWLREVWKEHGRGEELDDLADLLLGQALLAEGSALSDPARFSRLIGDLLAGAGPA